MHFDYKSDAPLNFECSTFIDHRRLIRHRDIYMGGAAAALAVYTDAEKIKGDGCEAAALLYRRSSGIVSRQKRRFAKELRDAAGEYYCHCMFFESLCSTASPDRKEVEKIEASFGTLQNFRYLFCQSAENERRAGYLWLIKTKNDRLKIVFTDGSTLPPVGCKAVLCLDLWEHAYAEHYGSDRAAYAAGFLSCAEFSRLLI